MIGLILLVIVFLFLIGSIPRWSYNRQWGYFPFGILTTLLIIIAILWILGIV